MPASRQRIFQGPSWSFPVPGCGGGAAGRFPLASIGDTPVVVVRDGEGKLNAFENRCAHRGALICLEEHGKGQTRFPVRLSWLELRSGR